MLFCLSLGSFADSTALLRHLSGALLRHMVRVSSEELLLQALELGALRGEVALQLLVLEMHLAQLLRRPRPRVSARRARGGGGRVGEWGGRG